MIVTSMSAKIVFKMSKGEEETEGGGGDGNDSPIFDSGEKR